MIRSKLFLDSSVLLSGLVSSIGASAEILRLAEAEVFELIVCQTVLDEVKRNLKKKLPEFLPFLYSAIDILKPIIAQDELKLQKELKPYFSKTTDQIIFQTAQKVKADYLITLDKKHLLTPKIKEISKVSIISPGEFVRRFKHYLNT